MIEPATAPQASKTAESVAEIVNKQTPIFAIAGVAGKVVLMDQEVPSASAPDGTSPNLSACILLVEDDRSVRRYLEVTLQRSGYRVLTAGDGLEAIKVAMSSPVDVVITDAVMPNLNGQQFAAFLRKNPKLSGIPIVLLTGQENRAAAEIADGSIDAFLNKPVKADELKSCVEKLLNSEV